MTLHSYSKVFIHLIWGTLNHSRIMNAEFRDLLYKHLFERSREIGILYAYLNIQPEHIHMLYSLPVDKSVSQIARELKGESSKWINEGKFVQGKFKWQRGYSAYSISASHIDVVRRYIRNQSKHHKKHTFREEYDQWIKKYQMETHEHPDQSG